MKRQYQTKKRKFNAGLMGFTAVLLSSTMCFLAACDEDTTDKDTTSTTTQTDTQTIANGNFEFYNNDTGLNPIASVNNWTQGSGTSVPESTAASGIVNTAKDVWSDLTESKIALADVNAATANWDNASVYDKLKFYEDCSIENKDDFDDYEYFNIDFEDIPACENPGTHDYDGTSEPADDAETSVLMIHNYRSDSSGTAQHYSSSSVITLDAGTSAKVSVWVKTLDLTYNVDTPVTANRGAYIGVTHTVGGTTLDQMQIKNIETSSVTENNGWVQYTVYIKASSYATSTFNLELGLGQGTGDNRFEYVQGYAFFDDITCEIISNADYDAATQSVPSCTFLSSEYDKLFNVDDDYAGDYVYALDLYRDFNDFDIRRDAAVTMGLTEERYGNIVYVTAPSEGKTVYKGLNLETKNDVCTLSSVSSLRNNSNSYLKTIMEKDFSSFPFGDSEDVIMLMSANGAAYTATMRSADFRLNAGAKTLFTFWVKTSSLNGYTGATVSLVDGENKTSISSVDSTLLSTVDTDEQEDLYDGWHQCFFFVQNTTTTAKEFYLTFSYGPTAIVGTTNASYMEGYAAFTNFQTYDMTDEEFGYASTGSYAMSVSLYGEYASDTSTQGFDNTIYSDSTAIENEPAVPLNYKGVDGGSSYVGGDSYSYANGNPNAGLINQNYADAYYANNDPWMSTLLRVATANDTSLANALNANTWWSKIIGDSMQPLLIVNTIEQSYGYIANSNSTLSSSSYTAVAVRVKVSKGAIAYVYLMDTSDLTEGYNAPVTLKTPEATYWYDDDGNVCKVDPSSDEFDKSKDIVYYNVNNDRNAEHTGLYTSANESDTKFYANLAAYEANDDGNLLTEGGDIAFYFNPANNTYYAYYDEDKDQYTTPVYDFDHSYARYTSEQAKASIVVDGNKEGVANRWINVIFYVRTGSDSKSYRLELFSGSRDGSVKSAADSYILFDVCSPNTLSSSYEGLLSEAVEEIKKDAPAGYTEDDIKWYDKAIYYTYTFYDDAAFMRYDENLDTEDVGDLYSEYVQSDYAEAISYLYYEDKISSTEEYTYSMFLNFSTVDQYVTPKTVDTDDDTDTDDTEIDWAQVLLLTSSIILVVVLGVVLIILLVRRIVNYVRKRKTFTENKYDSKKNQYKRKVKLDKSDKD